MLVGDTAESERLARKVTRGMDPSTPMEVDATVVELWCQLLEAEQANVIPLASSVKVVKHVERSVLQGIEQLVRKREDQAEVDLLML